jgi:hypothetical protein
LPSPSPGTYQCTCAFGSDCNTGSCAPAIDALGNPIGPYVCKFNDGKLYDGCNGAAVECAVGCCFEDSFQNLFCATECVNDSQCGAAKCQTYGNDHTLCSGTLGCGPASPP